MTAYHVCQPLRNSYHEDWGVKFVDWQLCMLWPQVGTVAIVELTRTPAAVSIPSDRPSCFSSFTFGGGGGGGGFANSTQRASPIRLST